MIKHSQTFTFISQ